MQTATMRLGAVLGAAVAVGACGAVQRGTRPDVMSVEEHRRAAVAHDEEAAEQRARQDPSATRVAVAPSASLTAYESDPGYGYGPSGVAVPGGPYNPSAVHLERSEEQERLAAAHRAAAAALERYEEASCSTVPAAERAVCPLMDALAAVDDVPGGARLTFRPDVDMDRAMQHVRCHLAFGRARGRSGMDRCPLYIRGVDAVRLYAGHQVELRTDRPALVPELRARVRAHLASAGAD